MLWRMKKISSVGRQKDLSISHLHLLLPGRCSLRGIGHPQRLTQSLLSCDIFYSCCHVLSTLCMSACGLCRSCCCVFLGRPLVHFPCGFLPGVLLVICLHRSFLPSSWRDVETYLPCLSFVWVYTDCAACYLYLLFPRASVAFGPLFTYCMCPFWSVKP